MYWRVKRRPLVLRYKLSILPMKQHPFFPKHLYTSVGHRSFVNLNFGVVALTSHARRHPTSTLPPPPPHPPLCVSVVTSPLYAQLSLDSPAPFLLSPRVISPASSLYWSKKKIGYFPSMPGANNRVLPASHTERFLHPSPGYGSGVRVRERNILFVE